MGHPVSFGGALKQLYTQVTVSQGIVLCFSQAILCRATLQYDNTFMPNCRKQKYEKSREKVEREGRTEEINTHNRRRGQHGITHAFNMGSSLVSLSSIYHHRSF
jgi:hypothetical protein